MKLHYTVSFVVEVDREEAFSSYAGVDFRLNPDTVKAQIENIERANVSEYGIDTLIDIAEEDTLSISITATEVPSETN